MEKHKLKVGDVIYKEWTGKLIARYTIERVTRTQAVANDGTRFQLEYEAPAFLYPYGKKDYTVKYRLKDDRLHQRWLFSLIQDILRTTGETTFTTDQLERILNILKEQQG